jgi:type II secretory pathway component PulF
MCRSGVDVASALGSLAAQCRRPALAHVLTDVHESVLAGHTLCDALGQHEETFGANYIATVAAGEASGRMPQVLEQLAKSQRSEIRSRRALKAMLTYPVLLMVVSSSVIVALVLFVLPRFADIFAQYELTLPPLTRLLIVVAEELRGRWFVWGPLAAGIVPGLLTWRKTQQGRRWLDSLWIHALVIREVYVAQLVARTCQTMGLMLESGVPLLESLRLTRQATTNLLYKELLAEMEEAVVNGQNLASALEHSDIIPQSVREMIVTAEATGKLGEVTQLLGAYYEEEAEGRMRQVVGLLEPVITVGMGVVVACVVLAVMLPVFDLSTLAQRNH